MTAVTRALTCAEYALLSDDSKQISFNRVIQMMKQTDRDLPSFTARPPAAG